MKPRRESKSRKLLTVEERVKLIRTILRERGSAEHAKGVQWFFKEEVQSRGWYTAALRRFAFSQCREIDSPQFLLAVADRLFTGEILDEKNVAVMLLERPVANFGDSEFKLLERWLDRVTSWADHDALVHYLLGPLIAGDRKRSARVFTWAKSRNRWRRRAAAVALIRAARQKKYFDEIVRVTDMLLDDADDMVQKGLGWLLRESAKFNPQETVLLLLKIRDRAPRLVLRTACETLPAAERARILGQSRQPASRATQHPARSL
jgi:3-methyladenine DNA glycosylase AlkD